MQARRVAAGEAFRRRQPVCFHIPKHLPMYPTSHRRPAKQRACEGVATAGPPTRLARPDSPRGRSPRLRRGRCARPPPLLIAFESRLFNCTLCVHLAHSHRPSRSPCSRRVRCDCDAAGLDSPGCHRPLIIARVKQSAAVSIFISTAMDGGHREEGKPSAGLGDPLSLSGRNRPETRQACLRLPPLARQADAPFASTRSTRR